MKKCIFHIPYKLDEKGMAAPMVRPRMMIQAFQNIGYQVEVISGDVATRYEKIKEIKNRIHEGEKFDFLYAENSTTPPVLNEEDHVPRRPLMDELFFRFLKKHGIKIGLFYRDIYWKFDMFKVSLAKWKSLVMLPCYQHEFNVYKRYVDHLFLPSEKMYQYMETNCFDGRVSALPPGGGSVSEHSEKSGMEHPNEIKLFYVGGIGSHYQIEKVFEAVNQCDNVSLTVCCRAGEWEKEKEKFLSLMSDNISIIHKSGEELEEFYSKADIGLLLFADSEYIKMAMPVKAFEYLAHCKPVIVTCNTAIASFVEENGTGWSIPYEVDEIKKTFQYLLDHPEQYKRVKRRCEEVAKENTWEKRAQKVADLLQ